MLLIGFDPTIAPLTRDKLEALTAAFPDERSDTE
jgi:hypothetical protein